MTSQLLRAVPGQPAQWPYSLRQLQADILAETNGATTISLDADPVAFTGAPFYLFPYVATDAPDVDARTQVAERADPVLTDGEWRQAWVIRDATPEEMAQFDQTNAPPPSWTGFQDALRQLTGMNAVLAACFSPQAIPLGGPTLYGGLVAGLSQVATGGSSATFLTAWRGGMMAGLITPQLAAQVVQLAAPFNLPAEFITGLNP